MRGALSVLSTPGRRRASGRRRGRRWSVAVATALAAACAPAEPPPNVLLVVLDTVRADAVTAVAGGGAATPALTALAAESTTFSSAWAAAPWTVPSHASLFTGLYPHAHRATHDTYHLDEDLDTLAEMLADAGYQTAGFTTNPWLAAGVGLAQGFQDYRETYKAAEDDPDQGSRRVTGEVLRWLDDRHPAQPFFVFVNYVQAHLPYRPPKTALTTMDPPAPDGAISVSVEQAERYLAGDRTLSGDALRRAYLAEVVELDRQVGALLDDLRRTGMENRTLLVVTSDHGELLGEHGLTGHEFSVHEELLRVPLLVRLPGVFGPSRRPEPVSLVDVVPTVLETVGVVPPAPLDGVSLRGGPDLDRPLLAEYSRPRRLIHRYWRTKHPGVDMSRYDRALRALRSGPLKLVVSSRGEEWLFDLSGDPTEAIDLADLRPHDLADLRRQLATAVQ